MSNARQANGARSERPGQSDRVRDEFIRAFTRRRLLFVAALHELASAAAREGALGYDGQAPEIIDRPDDGDNPQMRVARNIREHPLDLMFYKNQISPDQFAAGERLRRDLEMAMISPLRGRNYESIYSIELSDKKALRTAGLDEMLGPKTFAARRGSAPMAWNDLSDLTLDAMHRANTARAAVAAAEGDGTADILEMLLREGRTVQDIAKAKSADGSSRFGARHCVGRKMQRGLNALARHYGMGGHQRVHPFHSDGGGDGAAVKSGRY